jgi:hypothetical protein
MTPRRPATRTAWRAGLAVLASLSTLAHAEHDAHADLSEDASRIERAWSHQGARVKRGSALFLEREHRRTLAIGLAERVDAEDCTTVVILAVRSVDVSASLVDESGAVLHDKDAARARAEGGVATISRCAEMQRDLDRIGVELLSSRGAVELVVARSKGALVDVLDVLPERRVGPIAPRGSPGPAIEPGSLASRLAAAERAAQRQMSDGFMVVNTRASDAGQGAVELSLLDGCHVVRVMAEVPNVLPRRATDVDAELVSSADGEVVAQDRGEAPDAELHACVGKATDAVVRFRGAPTGALVAVSDALRPISPAVPNRFGPRVRSAMAAALIRRGAPEPRGEPFYQALGAQGATHFSVEVVRDRCYLASLGLMRGEARAQRLRIRAGSRTLRDTSVGTTEGLALAFCADADRAFVDVDVASASAHWALSMWDATGFEP